MDPLGLTPYIEDCIKDLSEKEECQPDRDLVRLARLQIVVGQIPSHFGADHAGLNAPAGLYVKALRAKLQELRKDLPDDSNLNRRLCLQPGF